jgi:septal ring factor EnvC (AmiA/AmiB activator)
LDYLCKRYKRIKKTEKNKKKEEKRKKKRKGIWTEEASLAQYGNKPPAQLILNRTGTHIFPFSLL